MCLSQLRTFRRLACFECRALCFQGSFLCHKVVILIFFIYRTLFCFQLDGFLSRVRRSFGRHYHHTIKLSGCICVSIGVVVLIRWSQAQNTRIQYIAAPFFYLLLLVWYHFLWLGGHFVQRMDITRNFAECSWALVYL